MKRTEYCHQIVESGWGEEPILCRVRPAVWFEWMEPCRPDRISVAILCAAHKHEFLTKFGAGVVAEVSR
jgi:hypothetical protein